MVLSSLLKNGVFIMLSSCLFFAAFDSLLKYLSDIFTIGQLAFVRFGLGSVLMLPSLFKQRLWLNRQDLFYLILRGVLGALAFYAMIRAFQTGTLSVSMVLFYTNPLWALFLGALFLKERLTGERIACILTAVSGVVMLVNPWAGGIAYGHMYALAAGFLIGGVAVIIRHLRARHDSQVIYAFQCFVGTLFSIPFLAGQVRLPGLPDGATLLAAAVFGLIAQIVMNHGFRYIRAAEGATLMMVEAVFTAMVGIILLHEPLTPVFFAGTVMILGSGIYLGLRSGRRG
jgi:drug/metabolite transporter (DMT)-like permease